MMTKKGYSGLALVLSALLAFAGCSDDDSSDSGLLAPAADISGSWFVDVTAGVGVPGFEVCGFEIRAATYELDIVQDGNGLVLTARVGESTREFRGTIAGTSLTWTGSYSQSGGTMQETFNGAFSADPTDPTDIPEMEGTSILLWTDDPDLCQAMSSTQGLLN